MASFQPWRGGARLQTLSAAVAVAGPALTLLGAFLDPRRALFAYLVAFVYWLGIALGALILLSALHAAKANIDDLLEDIGEALKNCG